MKTWFAAVALAAASSFTQAAENAITVYQDPNCGCCSGWVDHMRDAGFEVKAIKTADMASIKQTLGVTMALSSCHTGVVKSTGQLLAGHVPSSDVKQLFTYQSVKGG